MPAPGCPRRAVEAVHAEAGAGVVEPLRPVAVAEPDAGAGRAQQLYLEVGRERVRNGQAGPFQPKGAGEAYGQPLHFQWEAAGYILPRKISNGPALGKENLTGYRPETDIRTGMSAFVDWYRAYYRL